MSAPHPPDLPARTRPDDGDPPGGVPVVLVVGRPASGKTTISRRIAPRFGLPLLAKDAFKEALHDSLGPGDLAWSQRLGRAAFAVLDLALEAQLRSGRPFVVDANYDPRLEQATFERRQRESGFLAVQVHCTAASDELVRRFAARAVSGERHAAHLDAEGVDAFAQRLREPVPEVLDLRGPVLRLDAAGGEPAAEAVLQRIGELLSDDGPQSAPNARARNATLRSTT